MGHMDKYIDSKSNSSNDRKKNVKKKTTKKRVGLTAKQKTLPKNIQDAILKKQRASK